MTKMKSISLSALLLCVLFIFSSCTKEEVATPADNPIPALSSGQYDQYGQNHNAILLALGNNSAFSSALVNGPTAPLVNVMVPITEQVTGCNSSCHQNSLTGQMMNSAAIMSGMNGFSDVATRAFNLGQITANDRMALNSMDALVANRKTMTQAAFQQSLVSFENNVSNNSSLSQNGKQAILIGSTVMRYSDQFWMNVNASGPGDPWYYIYKIRHAPIGPPWYVRDAAAAVAIAAEPVTWVFGPWAAAAIIAGGSALVSAG